MFKFIAASVTSLVAGMTSVRIVNFTNLIEKTSFIICSVDQTGY